MPDKFFIKTLVTYLSQGNQFNSPNFNDPGDKVFYQDEFTGAIGELNRTDEIKYGYRLLAGEPCPNDLKRVIVYLQVGKGSAPDKPLRTVLTFRYPRLGEIALEEILSNLGVNLEEATLRLKIKIDLFNLEDELPPNYDPDPGCDPITYPDPDPDSELPTYDDNVNDDPPDADDPQDPPSSEGSDCNGTIGVSA